MDNVNPFLDSQKSKNLISKLRCVCACVSGGGGRDVRACDLAGWGVGGG